MSSMYFDHETGILTVEGSENEDSFTMHEYQHSDGTRYGIASLIERRKDTKEILTNVSLDFPLSKFKQVVARGRGGKDVIAVYTGTPLVAWGGSGDDWLIGGNAADYLHGGEGVDRLEGFNGNDTLKGGNGMDFLYGGAGKDSLEGGNGKDYLHQD